MTRIPTAERRAALTQAALTVVAERGVAGATTRAIAAAAGMPQASVHYAFESRDELMTALVAHAIDVEQQSLQPALDADAGYTDLRHAIRTGLDHYLAAVRLAPDTERALFELTQFALRSPERARLARQQYEGYRTLAAATLEVAAEKCGCRWLRPVDEVARLLVVFTDGLTLGWLVDRDDAAAAAAMDFAADTLAALAEPGLHAEESAR